MTKEEFQQKVTELILEFNEPDVHSTVFVHVHNIDNKEAFSFGYGCPGCAFERIKESAEMGQLDHHDKLVGN